MTSEVTMVKIYLTEGDKLLKAIMGYLHDEVKVSGVTILRAMSGFGKSGVVHSSNLLSMSLDLPLIVEFFDKPEKIINILPHLKNLVGEGHIICSQAELY